MRLFALILLAACTSPDPKESKESSGDSTAVDVDSDGFVVGEDCDDGNAAINPGAKESCDGIDNNCDELIDDSSSIDQPLWYGDDDGDGYGADATSTSACTQPAGYVATGGDCNDNDPLYHPGADESCESAEDYNCDGSVEYADADADGFPACLDCNDGDPGIHEGAAERCDGLDQDCDGVIDEDAVDATAWYQDSDADSHGDASVSQTACEAPAGFVASSDDCNDADAAFYPGATETCEDPQDYNCDGSVGGADNDGDGFLACLECDDGDAAINPSAEEICDGLDNNCDGAIDDNSGGASTWYVDADLDGYGDPSASLSACTQPAGYVADNTDCNDQDAAYNPGAAEADCTDPNDYNCDGSSGFSDTDGDGFPACEDCDDTRAEVNPDGIELCNGLDDNCDGSTDDSSATDAQIWYIDADADNFGLDGISQLACTAPTGYVADNTDCSDSDAGSYPGATEFCDGVDNNCDGTVDEDSAADALEWYQDSDADGFGDATTTTFSCSQPTGFVPDATDCDDSVDTTYPGATEYCNGDDDNCDGVVDEDSAADAPTWYRDADVDGYGAPSLSRNACFQPIGYVSDDTDCNDAAQGVNPGEIEICDSGNVDEDCNGLSDDGDVGVDGGTFTEFYEDADGDSYGSIPGGFCDLPAGYVTNSTDCDDGDAAINPAATEICDSGNVDEDCDGSADDNDSSVDASTFDTWYQDSDADTYGNLQSTLDRCDLPSGYVADSRDCNDGDASINPSATEICDSSNVDEDCDGLSDDADSSVSSATKSTWYQDSDADTYGNLQATIARCDLPSGYVANSTDCNDTNAAINPAATEICDSSNVDEDCDGVADDSDSSVSAATKSSWYQDSDGDSYGNLSISLSRCDQPAGYVSSSTDCNDSSAVISPAATEICDSGNVDEDCDGVADDNDSSTSAATKSTWYRDADGDTYGTTATTLARCDLPSG